MEKKEETIKYKIKDTSVNTESIVRKQTKDMTTEELEAYISTVYTPKHEQINASASN